MNCKQAQHLLKTAGHAQIAADTALQAHLAGCDECGAMGKELELIRLLANAPVPASSHGFADRALARAWETAHPQSVQPLRKQPYTWAGIAASVVMAGVLMWQYGPQKTDVPPSGGTLASGPVSSGNPASETASETVVQVAPQVTQPVHVRLVSKEALPDATITILWDDNLALAGYSTGTSLSWQSSLTAGVNELTLPVMMKSGVSGEIVIEVTAGNAQKQMRFRVKRQSPAVALLQPRLQAGQPADSLDNTI